MEVKKIYIIYYELYTLSNEIDILIKLIITFFSCLHFYICVYIGVLHSLDSYLNVSESSAVIKLCGKDFLINECTGIKYI